MTTVDYKKNVPVLGSYEVVVAGAGPAGICAAVAAARSGARVALVEKQAPPSLTETLEEAGYIVACLDVLSTCRADMGAEGYFTAQQENARAIAAAFAQKEETH